MKKLKIRKLKKGEKLKTVVFNFIDELSDIQWEMGEQIIILGPITASERLEMSIDLGTEISPGFKWAERLGTGEVGMIYKDDYK